MTMGAHALVQKYLAQAGIALSGSQPWDIRVHDLRFYRRVLAGGSLALGESYTEGWWDVDALDVFFTRIIRLGMEKRFQDWRSIFRTALATAVNAQRLGSAHRNAQVHYDLGNDLYRAMLDKRMV